MENTLITFVDRYGRSATISIPNDQRATISECLEELNSLRKMSNSDRMDDLNHIVEMQKAQIETLRKENEKLDRMAQHNEQMYFMEKEKKKCDCRKDLGLVNPGTTKERFNDIANGRD